MNQIKILNNLNEKIIKCRKCPRLVSYIHKVAKVKTKRFFHEKYWEKPLPGFGDINAKLLIVGLAPAAHGGNRTGRMFTGDSSGDWVARILYEYGYATKATSERIGDGYNLVNCYITASLRCAPPDNKPLKKELENCFSFLEEELVILKNVRVIICLGRIAFETVSKLLHIKGAKFSHGKMINHQGFTVICSYHPSRQNTQTGRLVWDQWSKIFSMTKRIVESK